MDLSVGFHCVRRGTVERAQEWDFPVEAYDAVQDILDDTERRLRALREGSGTTWPPVTEHK